MSVSTVVKSIQDIMRKDVGVDGDAQRISQLCWMFFLKIIDDRASPRLNNCRPQVACCTTADNPLQDFCESTCIFYG
jgi:type I restriction-modification system DNA methylase subunit